MTDYALDMTMMLATHAALRRDLEHVQRLDARNEGYGVFEQMLRAHHETEDELLWPVVREAVAGRADDLALLDQMEAEHHEIEPALEALDRGLAKGKPSAQAKANLETRLRDHLTHEERDMLPLIDGTLTAEQWAAFGQASAQRMGPNMAVYLPWMLEGADDDTKKHVLAMIPPPVQKLYADQWAPAYAAVDRWKSTSAA